LHRRLPAMSRVKGGGTEEEDGNLVPTVPIGVGFGLHSQSVLDSTFFLQ